MVKRLYERCNLNMILSVGYLVKSKEGMRFRHWANTVICRKIHPRI